MRTFGWLGIGLVGLLATAAAAQQIDLRTGDGFALQLSPDGRVTSVGAGETRLPLVAPGGFALADFQDQPEPLNLIANPGFEAGAEGWSLLAATQTIDQQVAHEGGRSARIEVGPDAASSSIGVTVAVKPNTTYRCELWIRRHQTGVCGAYASERNDQNELTGAQTQVGRTVPAQDDVWHHLVWELTTQPATTRLNLRGDIYRSTGTIWLDDFSVAELPSPSYEPVTGSVEQDGDGWRLRGGLKNRGLELEARWTAGAEAIRVDGEVRDLTGQDRAIAVRFGLPLDAAGWTWYRELEESEPVEASGVYRYTYRCVSGSGECSIYPWSALDGPNAGISLALPLDQGPRVFVIQHDQRAPELSLTFFFGLSPEAGRHPSRAPFAFVLYRHDPAWGMRSALERYYRLFPTSFEKRMPFEGYLNYANLERLDPAKHQLIASGGVYDDASDFGEGYKFLWHMHGCYDFRMVPYDHPDRPSDDEVRQMLAQMVAEEKDTSRHYVPTSETLKKLTYGPDGEILYIGDTRYWRPQEGYNHNDWPGWGLNFRVNEDPGVSSYLAEVTRQKLEEYAKGPLRRPFDSCLTADAIEGYFANSHALDYRREHFATTQVPLTFGKDALRPALPNTIWDFLSQVWWPLTQQYQVVTYGNANGYEQAFTMPFVDVPMIEWGWDRDHPGRFERYLRAIAHHKIWRYWRVMGNGESDPASVRENFAAGLAYAVYPAVYPLNTGGKGLETWRDLYRQYVPATEELSQAGWEPVPHATVSEGAVIERYGDFAGGELHFTLRNYGDEAVEAQVTLNRAALGIPAEAELVAADILPGVPTWQPLDDAHWQVAVPGKGSRAFWIGTREQLAQHGYRLAARTLGKIERSCGVDLTDARGKLAAAATGDDALRQQTQALVDRLESAAPVDLAKLAFRLRTDLSWPDAAAGLLIDGPRVLDNGLPGAASTATWQAKLNGRPLAVAEVRVLSPWPEVAAAAKASVAGGTITASLAVPADPPRTLLPYLFEVTAQDGDRRLTVDVPLDLKLGRAVEVEALPDRVFRGQATRLVLRLTSRLERPVKVSLTLKPPQGVTVTPATVTADLAAHGSADCPVTLTLPANARLGELQLPFEVAGDEAVTGLAGSLALSVSDPVPQVAVPKLQGTVDLDGELTEAAWQGEPTIPVLTLLRGGKPATEATSVWLTYDDAGLYVALRCSDSQMGKVRAILTDRGAPLYQDDDIEVFLLPPGAVRAFQLAVNPLGTRSDNFGNDRDWQAAARQHADSWAVELHVPWSTLELDGPPPPGTRWACQFGRQQKAKGEVSSWTPGAAFNVPEGFGEVVFQ